MEKEYVVKLDVYLGILEARVISFNQLNTGTCKLSFELTSNKQALDLTGKKVTFEVTTPSGATLEDAILVTDATQGKCECTLANDMIAEQGLHCGEINVYSADHGKMLTFKKFMYLVNGQLGAKDITVDTRYSTLQELIFDVENLKNQSVIDTEAVAQMKNETDLMHKEVIVKHGDVEVKHQEVVTLAQSVKDDASRTGSNAQQVSTDKGIVTKAKNEVVAKHDEVLKTAGVIAQDTAIVEQAKTETLGYKNDVEAMKNDVQQLVTDSTEDLILEGNRQVVRVSTEGTTQVDLAKAEVTKATQQATVATEQATIATTKSEEATTQADRATREADRAGAQAQEKVNNKIGLNGVHDDTIFNFIGDKGNAIKELHTTDAEGKTSILKLGSDSHHVEMDTGRTLQAELDTYRAIMGKEIVSADGSAIEVNNAIPSKVLSAEIKGNTIKTFSKTAMDLKPARSAVEVTFNSDNTFEITRNGDMQLESPFYGEKGRVYTIIANVISNNTTSVSRLVLGGANEISSAHLDIAPSKVGLIKYKFTANPNDTSGKIKFYKPATSGGLFKLQGYVLLEGDWTSKTDSELLLICKSFKSGLNSTQAIIENNGQSYPIYEPTIHGKTRILDADTGLVPTDPTLPALKDGDVLDLSTRTITFANKTTRVLTDEEVKAYSAFKKVISLGRVGDVKDTLEILEDGSVVYTQNTVEFLLNGSIVPKPWFPGTLDTNNLAFVFTQYNNILGTPYDASNNAISNMLPSAARNYLKQNDTEGIATFEKETIIGKISRLKLKTQDMQGIADYFKENNLQVRIKLETPIVTHIPKELVPAILTHNQTNILEVGGAVKPSSFKVTLPVDRIAELTARLEAVEAKTNTQPVNTAFVDETYAKSVNKIEEVIK